MQMHACCFVCMMHACSFCVGYGMHVTLHVRSNSWGKARMNCHDNLVYMVMLGMVQCRLCTSINQSITSINQLTFLVFRTHQGSQGLGRMHVAHAAMPMCPCRMRCNINSTGTCFASFWHRLLAGSTEPCRNGSCCLYAEAAYQASNVPNPGVW